MLPALLEFSFPHLCLPKSHEWVSESHSVVCNSLQSHRLYSPCNSPGQHTGVGSLSLLQGIFPTQGSNPGLPHWRRILYQLSHKPAQIPPLLQGSFQISWLKTSLATIFPLDVFFSYSIDSSVFHIRIPQVCLWLCILFWISRGQDLISPVCGEGRDILEIVHTL